MMLIEAVRKNPLTSKATDDMIEKEVKEWLKFAAERDGKRRERDIRKRSDKPVSRRQTSRYSVESDSPTRSSRRETSATYRNRKPSGNSSHSSTSITASRKSSASRSPHRDDSSDTPSGSARL